MRFDSMLATPNGGRNDNKMVSRNRYRVLLLAEAANPALSSVALIGWSMSRAVMGRVEGLLVTELRNREAIQEDRGMSEDAVEYIDNRTLQNGAFQLSKWMRGGNALGWTAHTFFSK